jgi:uncharacterized protein YeaO (DUF488 family)
MRLVVAVVLVAVVAIPVWARDERPAEEARARMEHHLKEFNQLSEHFETVMTTACPHFASTKDWSAYLDSEIDRVVLMVAHLEQAWYEATRTGDDDVRRTAKAPRRRLDQARALLDKLQGCAESNGSSFSPLAVWRRIEREVPQRQAEIALPN